MLVVAKSLRELRFGELMSVYSDSVEKAASHWPEHPRGLAMQLAEQDIYQYLKDVLFVIPETACVVWEDGGRYVSALRLEPYRDGMLLSALETAPDIRRRGYASALIRGTQSYLAQKGPVKLYSHVNKGNAVSLAVHKSCGFSVIADHAAYLDGSVDHRCRTLLYEV